MWSEELSVVFVRGDDDDIHIEIESVACGGGDDVIGFPACQFDAGDIETGDELFDEWDLWFEVRGDFGAVGFVLGVDEFAGTGAWGIECADEVGGLSIEDGEEVAGDAEDGIGGLSAGTGHGWYGVKDLEHQRKSVDEVQAIASHV